MPSRVSNNIPPSLLQVWHKLEESKSQSIDKMATTTKAIVSRDTLDNGGWSMEEVTVRDLKEGELLVDVIASGICHTGNLLPIILPNTLEGPRR